MTNALTSSGTLTSSGALLPSGRFSASRFAPIRSLIRSSVTAVCLSLGLIACGSANAVPAQEARLESKDGRGVLIAPSKNKKARIEFKGIDGETETVTLEKGTKLFISKSDDGSYKLETSGDRVMSFSGSGNTEMSFTTDKGETITLRQPQRGMLIIDQGDDDNAHIIFGGKKMPNKAFELYTQKGKKGEDFVFEWSDDNGLYEKKHFTWNSDDRGEWEEFVEELHEEYEDQLQDFHENIEEWREEAEEAREEAMEEIQQAIEDVREEMEETENPRERRALKHALKSLKGELREIERGRRIQLRGDGFNFRIDGEIAETIREALSDVETHRVELHGLGREMRRELTEARSEIEEALADIEIDIDGEEVMRFKVRLQEEAERSLGEIEARHLEAIKRAEGELKRARERLEKRLEERKQEEKTARSPKEEKAGRE